LVLLLGIVGKWRVDHDARNTSENGRTDQ
jgi:hypothetical protein